MAFDGITLAHIKNEIEREALGLRVDKIYNPTKEELLFVLGGGKSKQLFISASSQSRIYFTNEKLENPTQPPMFCMLLRKHLIYSRIISVRQIEMDRVLYIDFKTKDNFGDEVILTLSIEIMGRHSNIILIGANGNVIDSIKRIGLETSSVRQILPGIKFFPPPKQEKHNILEDGAIDLILDDIKKTEGLVFEKLISIVMGLSPVISKEICYRSFVKPTSNASELTINDYENIKKTLEEIKTDINEKKPRPNIVFENKKPMDFSAIYLSQYSETNKIEEYKTLSKMLEFYYIEKYRIERVKSRSYDILRVLNTSKNRINKKIIKQEKELKKSLDREKHQQLGDLINANMHSITKGEKEALIVNYYSVNQEKIKISLDPKLNPGQNAQLYYKKYKKAGIAFAKLTELIEEGKAELEYIETVLDSLYRSNNEQELEMIRQELVGEKYIKAPTKKNNVKKIVPYSYYMSSDGMEIISGKNNKANDELSIKISAGSDIWLHTKNIPGSHVVISRKGAKNIEQSTIIEAAKIAALHSKAAGSSNVAVDYTEIRYVRKQKGAKPGMVVYENHKTVFVTPNKKEVEKLSKLK